MNNEIICEHKKLSVSWEDEVIDIPFDFGNDRELILYTTIRGLISRVEKLEIEKNKNKIVFEDYSNEIAKSRILSFIERKKKFGNEKVNIYEMMIDLHLPANQIEEIMKELENEKVVLLNE